MKDLEITAEDTAIALNPKPSLLQMAVARGADIDTIERLVALHEREIARGAEVSFNKAMNQAQTACGPVATDLDNKQTSSRYASYHALDQRIRPIYTKHGFSISYNTGDSLKPEHVKVFAIVSHSEGHTRTYEVDMPADGKGAKGGDVMTKTHATGAATSYGMRYLLKMIFNISIGEEDTDGNGVSEQWVVDYCDAIMDSTDEESCYRIFKEGYMKAQHAKDQRAMKVIMDTKNKRKAQICK